MLLFLPVISARRRSDYLGMDVVDAIAAVKTDGRDKPLEPVVMEGIAVYTYDEDGADYDGEDIAAQDEN